MLKGFFILEQATKILLIVCFILVAILGFISGIIYTEFHLRNPISPKIEKPSNGGLIPSTDEGAEWHELGTFQGSDDDYRCFNIQGDKFKVVMSAVPMITYQPNSMQVDVIKDNSIVATKTIEWGATEYPNKKREIIEVTSGPGKYCIMVYSVDLENWQVTIWDYY